MTGSCGCLQSPATARAGGPQRPRRAQWHWRSDCQLCCQSSGRGFSLPADRRSATATFMLTAMATLPARRHVGFLAGSLFSLCVSGLADPAVILGLLDLARNLTLLFVMAACLTGTLIGCRMAFAPGHPQWSSQVGVPPPPRQSTRHSFQGRWTGGPLSGMPVVSLARAIGKASFPLPQLL